MAVPPIGVRWAAQPFAARVERPLIAARRVAPPSADHMAVPRLADPMAGPPTVRPEVRIMAEQQFIVEALITVPAPAWLQV